MFTLITGINGQLKYSLLEGNSSSDFGIGTDNGTIYTLQNLDRETRSVYSLIVIATDQAEPSSSQKSTTTEVSFCGYPVKNSVASADVLRSLIVINI